MRPQESGQCRCYRRPIDTDYVAEQSINNGKKRSRTEGDVLLMFGNKIVIKLATASPNPAITQSAACQENTISSSEVTPGSAAFPRSPAKL